MLECLDNVKSTPLDPETFGLCSTRESTSSILQREHKVLVKKFTVTSFTPIKKDRFSLTLFDLIKLKSRTEETTLTQLPEKKTVIHGLLILERFLDGEYWGKNLSRLKKYLTDALYQIQQKESPKTLKEYFSGLLSITKLTENDTPDLKMVFKALQSLDAYAIQSNNEEKFAFIRFYRSKTYRVFFKEAWLMLIHSENFHGEAVPITAEPELAFRMSYFLNFLALGKQARGLFPYDSSDLENIISTLSPSLQKAIMRYQEALLKRGKIEDKTQRFWFVADEIPVIFNLIEDNREMNKSQTVVMPPKMRIYTRRMQRDERGHLQDKQDNEGWPLYAFLKEAEFKKLRDSRQCHFVG